MQQPRPHTRVIAKAGKRQDGVIWWAGAMVGLILALFAATLARAESKPDMIISHGYSFYGDLKYPPDFEHFDYVNPDAPKGGEISFSSLGTFDSMNPYTRKGRRGQLSWIMYESLLGDAPTGGSAPADIYGEQYCLLCESVEYPKGKEWVIFRMRPEARFSDGTPVTAHDVLFSHNLLLDDGLKSYADAVRKRIPKAEVLDDHTIKFYFAEDISRRSLVDQVGNVPVWSQKWFEETGSRLDESRLKTSPGSGPYMVDSIDINRRIVYKRNPDYWGAHLAINKGRHNFDRIRVEYFGDDTAAFEAFKAGEFTFQVEGDSKKWATGYEFPKVQQGHIVKKELPDGTPPTPTGIVFNLGRKVLKDKRVREALALAFNFEWTNESLQYGLFKQRASYTQDTPLMATGTPEGAELEFLQSLGDLVPQELIEEEVRVPHASSPKRLFDRKNARQAMQLLDDAGYAVGSDGMRVGPNGKPLKLTFLFSASSPSTLRGVMENYVSNVQKLGIDVTLEVVDSAQYTARERDRDYDLVYDSYTSFLGTGTGLAQRFGSEAAEFSLFNPAGLASPLVDAIIERSLLAESQEEENASLMALDRALRYEFIMIPVWYNDSYWVAYYDMYEHPEIPPYALGHLDFWWWNDDKAKRLKAAGVLR